VYDFEIDSIQELREFIELNRDLKLKKDRNIVYFAVPYWSLEGACEALQMIQNRPCWDWAEVRATITTYFFYHQSEVGTIRTVLRSMDGENPVVICRLINLQGSLKQIERKYKS
jgi:hypothetical protein